LSNLLRAFLKMIKINHENVLYMYNLAGGIKCIREDKQIQTEVAASKTPTVTSTAHALDSH
jgi:hypothetical protein